MRECSGVIGVNDETRRRLLAQLLRGTRAARAALLVALLLAAMGAASTGFAQSSSPATQKSPAAAATPQAQAAGTPTGGVEEIVVTAQKREQLSEQVPIALTALTASNIQFRGIDDFSDLEMQVPGLQFGQDTGADQQVYIRGVGIDDASGSVEAPIATYINGVYQTRTFRAPTLGLDLDRIEVLKGPQGTLFGRNATGGAVNIILQKPTDELTAAVKGGVGSYGQALTQGFISGPLIKGILDFRLVGEFQRNGGWIINLNTDRPMNPTQAADGRFALSFHPVENFSIDYNLIAGKLIGGGVNGLATNIVMGPPSIQTSRGVPIPIPASSYVNTSNPWKGKFAWPDQGDQENTQNDVTAKWDLASWATLKSITAFQQHTLGGIKWPAIGVAAPLLNFAGRNNNDKAVSEELNLGGNLDWPYWKTHQQFSWLLGAYYTHEDYSSAFDPIYANENTLKLGLIGQEHLNDYSVFGDGTLPLPWNFSLFGGVRYTYDKKVLHQTFSLQVNTLGPTLDPYNLGPFTPPLNVPGATCYDIKEVNNSHGLTPRVGMGWAPSETLNFYVKYSEGYNAGGFYYNSCNDQYKEEHVDTVEGGVKARWFDGRLVADAAGYWNTFKDYQIFTQLPSPAGTVSGVINAPKAEMWGGEFQITAIPFENFTTDLGISIMHSQYDTLFNTDGTNPGAGVQDLAGHQMQRAPNHTESVGLEYSWQVPWERVLGPLSNDSFRLGALRLRGEWYHTDYIVFQPFGKTGFGGANDVQNPYSIFNLYATLPTADGKWSLRFFAKNFLAQQYFQYKVSEPYSRFGVGGMPQWFGGDLTYRFQ